MLLNKGTGVYASVQENLHLLLNGTVLSIDPSIGSASSMPGWAVGRAGKLVASGELEIDASRSVPLRLQELHRLLRELVREWEPDVLVYEDIPASRHGGGAAGHASLLKAVGVVLSIAGPRGHVGILPISWKRLVRPSYIKGDREDAEEILYIITEAAKEIQEEDPPRKFGEKRKKSKKKDSLSVSK
jgi:hypothetical protein